MDKPEFNRRATADDFLKQTNEVRDERRIVPISDILDAPLYCLRFNEEWKSHIIGAVSTLQTWTAWVGDDDDTNTGTRQITKFLAQDFEDCGEDCTIETLLADDVFFETEYLPATFGDYYSDTVANESAQAAAYDGTPQSIAPDAPTGVPDDTAKNALCAAVNRFVGLYASTKLCLIRSKNFAEVLWTKIANAANNFYDATVTLMSPVYTPNIFSCFVSDAAAITALQDDAAIEELACFIYDELKTVTMSQSNFDDAILAAATTLTGNAGDIACLMQNDNNLSVYINMLEAYQIALIQMESSVDVPCPCETGSYRLWSHDFTQGLGVFRIQWSGTAKLGTLSGGRVQGTLNAAGTQKAVRLSWDDFDPTWRLKSLKVWHSQTGAGTNASNTRSGRARPTPDSNTGQFAFYAGSSVNDGDHISCGTFPVSYFSGTNQLYVDVTCVAAGNCYIDRIEVLFVDGFAPSGAYTNDDDLCT